MPDVSLEPVNDADTVDRAASALAQGKIPRAADLDVLLACARRGAPAPAVGAPAVHAPALDPATGLPNRASFLALLERDVEHSGSDASGTLFIVAIENFQEVNHTLGHQIGNDILRTVGRRLKLLVPPGATISRLSGVEFGILAPHMTSRDAAAVLAETVIHSLQREPLTLDETYSVDISASIGIARFPTDGNRALGLIRHADLALSRARAHRAGRYMFYHGDLADDAQRQSLIKLELRHALADRQFQVYYQPKVDVATGRIIGMEALLRWKHPIHEMIPPSEFIPIAEQTGVITPISDWMMREALTQTKAWNDAGLDLRVAVNLSTVQFRRQSVIGSVTALVEDSGLDPKRVEIEVTESVLLSPDENVNETFAWLKHIGIPIALDDFGTGYSSLSYLTRFPADVVKIDASFIRDLHANVECTMITEAIVALAHSLNMRVVAEGVERQAHLETLRTINCDYAQGYLFARPLPAPQFEALVRDNHNMPTADVVTLSRLRS
jgi:diguanylate cyclase (GGDEF)-like protein